MPDLSVSVITIFLNAGDYLEEAIASVLAQSIDDWELLLVDDGSSDQSSGTARAYAERYPGKIRYLEHEGHANRGMSASRNLGIDHAGGRYVAFLDADDVWLPERLERHLAVLEARPEVDMVYGPTLYWYSWTGRPQDQDRDVIGPVGLQSGTVVEPPNLLSFFLENRGRYTPGIGSILARREAMVRIGGFDGTFRGLFEDQVFFAKICLESRVCVLDACLDKYRQHLKSAVHMALIRGDYSPARPNQPERRFLCWLDAYVRQRDLANAGLRQAIDTALWPYRHPIRAAGGRFLRRPLGELRSQVKDLLWIVLPPAAFAAIWRLRIGFEQHRWSRAKPAGGDKHDAANV